MTLPCALVLPCVFLSTLGKNHVCRVPVNLHTANYGAHGKIEVSSSACMNKQRIVQFCYIVKCAKQNNLSHPSFHHSISYLTLLNLAILLCSIVTTWQETKSWTHNTNINEHPKSKKQLHNKILGSCPLGSTGKFIENTFCHKIKTKSNQTFFNWTIPNFCDSAPPTLASRIGLRCESSRLKRGLPRDASLRSDWTSRDGGSSSRWSVDER